MPLEDNINERHCRRKNRTEEKIWLSYEIQEARKTVLLGVDRVSSDKGDIDHDPYMGSYFISLVDELIIAIFNPDITRHTYWQINLRSFYE